MPWRTSLFALSAFFLFISGRGQSFQRVTGPFVESPPPYEPSPICSHADGSWTYQRGSSVQWIDAQGAAYQACSLHSEVAGEDLDRFDLRSGLDGNTIVVIKDSIVPITPGWTRLYFGLASIDPSAGVQWSTRGYLDEPEEFTDAPNPPRLAAGPDGGGFLELQHWGDPTIVRYGPDGALNWATRLMDTALTLIIDLVPDENGGCYFLGGDNKIVLGHIDSTGTLDLGRVIQPADTLLHCAPYQLLRTQEGHLVVLFEDNTYLPNRRGLMELSPTGEVLGISSYVSLYGMYQGYRGLFQRSDGALFLDFYSNGPGFVHLDATGEPVQAYHFPYVYTPGEDWELLHLFGNGWMHDRMGFTGIYRLTNNLGDESHTNMVWAVDAFELELCGAQALSITRVQVPLDQVESFAALISVPATIGQSPLLLTTTLIPPGELLDFCALYPIEVSIAEHSPKDHLLVQPGLIATGSLIELKADGLARWWITDATGRLIAAATVNQQHSSTMIPTAGWGPGVYAVRGLNDAGRSLGVARVVVQ